MEKYKNDPTDEFDTITMLTPEDEFYSLELELSEPVEQYIEHLERKIKMMKNAVKILHDVAEQLDDSTFFEKNLWTIYKL